VSRSFLSGVVLVAAIAGCGNPPPGLVYTNPTTGALLLVKDKTATRTDMVLDLVVGSAPLTGYATGLDLPLAPTKVTFGSFTPGTALSPGSSPTAANAAIPTTGPLADNLVVAQSQKASGTGAVATDTMLPPGAVLFTVELDYVEGADGVVFDGLGSAFVLPSGGLLDRAGDAVVTPAQVGIGKLEAEK
jgi:hypothetical protein